jgi:predicted transcriptional regulator
MKFSDAINQAFVEFNLSAKEIAARSGLTESQLSRFRNGRDIRSDNLERLIEALPEQAKEFLFFKCFVNQMSDRAIGTLLYTISLRMRDESTQSAEPERVKDQIAA